MMEENIKKILDQIQEHIINCEYPSDDPIQ